MDLENRGLDLERELTCSICTEVLYQPLTLLDCLHTFCGACLKEWFTIQLNKARNAPNSLDTGTTPYTCPSCRAPVRDTRPNATVTTLLEMFVAANPDKVRTAEEKEELAGKYAPGENVLPKVETREKTLRERRREDEDRRLIEEVTALSLREAGVENEGARRERRRREGSSHGSRSQSSRDTSTDPRSAEDRERRRRREAETERRRVREDVALRPEGGSDDRRRRRSDDEARRRHDEVRRSNVRQVEHQSSLRSLISSSDVDSREMEEEILRQIREEGLLDGIDLENIDVNQEDQISERIAEAFRRRQAERRRQEPARRSDASARSGNSGARRQTRRSAPPSREASGDEGVRTTSRRHRTHSRSTSAVSTGEQSRPPPSMSAIQASHLDVNSSDEGSRRRRRTTSTSRSATTPVPVAEMEARPATRSQTDLSNRPQSYHAGSRPSISESLRGTTDPTVHRPVELPGSENLQRTRRFSQSSRTPSSSPRIPATAQPEMPTASSPILNDSPRTRAAAPANIHVPPSSPISSSDPTIDRSLLPAPLSPRMPSPSRVSLSDRATAMGSASRPTSAHSPTQRVAHQLYPEPSLTCARCSKPHIEYELHYNCSKCSRGNYNICLSCYRAGKGCLNWYGFGYAAWRNWEAKLSSGDLSANAEKPHMLTASRYTPPKATPGGADGRKTLTADDPHNRLQSGAFCANCLAWANNCYWRCDACNEGDWGFCNNCVNQGKSCTHSLLPLSYIPSDPNHVSLTPTHDQEIPASARILKGPGVTGIGNFKPLTFDTSCDVCRYPIQPSVTRYHCFFCISKVPNRPPGDYDICVTCYPKLESSRRISAENGHQGWHRCLQGHRMVIIGFEDSRGGQCRIIVKDLVGGRGLSQKPTTIKDSSGSDLLLWSWGDGRHADNDGIHKKLVTLDVMKSSPINVPELALEKDFPADGGVGMKAVATWSWYPAEETDDELLFPKGAELRECKDVNGDWFHGTYMGKTGLFPSNYVRVLDGIS
ncbi:hypothetical protein B0O99DRAFT_289610 [Bisporella sp. PMI_857]|nr:hypothetical protein B0O99DRAFT_289610 [Bisporella sp. PMI_857]